MLKIKFYLTHLKILNLMLNHKILNALKQKLESVKANHKAQLMSLNLEYKN